MANNRYASVIRTTKGFWFVVFLLSAPAAFALTELDAVAEFQKLKGHHKAIAISGCGTQVISSIAHSEQSPAVASIKALAKCEAKRLAMGSDTFCEIRFSNNGEVTPAHKIRTGVPDQHPLFLWRLVSGQSTVYLAGSIHVLKQSLHPLPQQYQSAFDNSDNIVVEVDTMSITPRNLAKLVNKYFLLPDSQSIQQVLNQSELSMLVEYLDARNNSIAGVEQLKPSMLAIQLSINQLAAMGYFQEYGVEKYFLKQLGSRNILHMETLEQQFQLLGSAPMTLQRELLRETIIRIDEMDEMMAALVTAWLSGDMQNFDVLTQIMSSPSPEYLAFSKRLLDERNIGMANKITGYLDAGGTYFVMLGAAHLTGENSVLSLLKQQGRTAIQVHSTNPANFPGQLPIHSC